MTVQPEMLAAIPVEYRRAVAQWLMERAKQFTVSWIVTQAEAKMAASVLSGAAVDLADPTSEDSTVTHAEQVLADLRDAEPADLGRRAAPAGATALEKHRERADRAEAQLAEFRDKLAALAALEDYIAESGQNAARNIRDLLAGIGEHDNDPRVQARAWGLEW